MIKKQYAIEKGNYLKAGEASQDIKRTLKQLGVAGSVLRRISVAAYETELNLVIHSWGGELSMAVDGRRVTLRSADIGPGIADIDMAMTAGFSTADETARDHGFGAGMGLPNMKRNADAFAISSQAGKGTDIVMQFDLEEAQDG